MVIAIVALILGSIAAAFKENNVELRGTPEVQQITDCADATEEDFRTDVYNGALVTPHLKEIREILKRRQTDASADWKAFAEKLSGREVEDFELEKYQEEYKEAPKDEKDDTFLGTFIKAALTQKRMVTEEISAAGIKLAGEWR